MIARRTNTSLILVVTILAGTSGCARPASSRNTLVVAPEAEARSPRDIIREAEIRGQLHQWTGYDLIARVRPSFLHSDALRPASAKNVQPVVYIDDLLAGDVSVLHEIMTSIIAEIRYVRPHEAFVQHGERSRGGEILVYTYRSRFGLRPD